MSVVLGGPRASRVRPAEAGLGRPPNGRHAGNLDSQLVPGSMPSASFFPSHFLHPTSSVFEVKVKEQMSLNSLTSSAVLGVYLG